MQKNCPGTNNVRLHYATVTLTLNRQNLSQSQQTANAPIIHHRCFLSIYLTIYLSAMRNWSIINPSNLYSGGITHNPQPSIKKYLSLKQKMTQTKKQKFLRGRCDLPVGSTTRSTTLFHRWTIIDTTHPLTSSSSFVNTKMKGVKKRCEAREFWQTDGNDC